MLCQLSYAPKGDGTRTRNLLIKDEGTPVCAAGRLDCQGARQPQRHRWLRGHGSNADLLVQSQAWYQFHHLASVWTGGLEPPTPGSRSRCAPVAPRPGGTHGGSRTRTREALDLVPLPVGLRELVVLTVGLEPTLAAVWAPGLSRLGYVSVDRAGFEPATFSLQGSCASWLRHRPVVAGAESNPPRKAYETSLIPDLPQRGVTGRTRTGFLRDHDPASRPLQTSATVDAGGLEPPAPCVSCRCATVAPRVGGGPRSARISSCRVSTGRSTVRASGPCACLSFERSKACGFTERVKEPSVFASSRQSRRRESNPRLLGYGPSVRPSGPRRHGVGGGS